jgi:hydrogenase maturation protein HypF
MADATDQTSSKIRTLVEITGVVQGVGFRPFVYKLATEFGLNGQVVNDLNGVRIDVEGPQNRIDAFIKAVENDHPPRASISTMETRQAALVGHVDFTIGSSIATDDSKQLLVSPDSCTCDSCLEELLDPADRRFRYPFINCTNCGPRFTIIEELPYDRAATTMKKFVMCPACRFEYDDPSNRRFHAEPNACPVCGPSLWLTDRSGTIKQVADPVMAAAAAMRDGAIVALKGLGGFQLACLAIDEEAVGRLRARKHRPHKPFALMVESADDAALYCSVSDEERRQLESVQRPIVLLESLQQADIAPAVAPGVGYMGMMLPYTPLHFLLMHELKMPLVMTSGNLSEEPICRTNTEALSRLPEIADRFLLHNRQIRSTYDDSVMMVVDEQPMMLRRARGYAPLPLSLPRTSKSILATGAELKSTFCLTRDDEAFVSQHIGDLENVETLLHYERTEMLFEHMFSRRPSVFVCDSHPGYMSTTYCHERHPTPLKVQHHQAHIASCLTENGHVKQQVIGVALDGTGYGDDGCVWGGEFFAGGLEDGFERSAQLEYFPLLGGEAAIKEPWRTAMALVWQYAPEKIDLCCERLQVADKKKLLLRQLEAGLNCPRTSSCGRLFDAVAALALGRLSVSYEAQAAMELEACALISERANLDKHAAPELDDLIYRFSLDTSASPWVLSPGRAISRIIRDIEAGEQSQMIAILFHLGLAEAIVRTSHKLAESHGTDTVALSGGVFQNRLLLRLVRRGLEREELSVLTHSDYIRHIHKELRTGFFMRMRFIEHIECGVAGSD